MAQDINELHQNSLNRKERFASFVTDRIGTIECAGIFACIGIASIVGIITNNTWLGIGVGAFSSYFLQLVLLPLILIKQNIDQRHAELLADETYRNVMRDESEVEAIHKKLDDLLSLTNE